MENFALPLIFVILGLSQLSMMGYYWHLGKQINKRLSDEEMKRLSRNDEMGWNSLHSAIKKGQAIVGEAEIESIKELAASSQQIGKLEREYSQEMGVTAQEVQKQLMAESARATEEFKKQLARQTEEIERLNDLVEETVKNSTEKMLLKFEKDLTERLMEVEEKSLLFAEREIAEVKKATEEYRRKKMEKIDEAAVEIVQKAAALAITKTFSISDHVEAIKNSLEEAKEEHFI